MAEHAWIGENQKEILLVQTAILKLKIPNGGVQYWFHSGNIFTTKAMWDAHDNLLKQQACVKNRTEL